jgi:hypothetical protein
MINWQTGGKKLWIRLIALVITEVFLFTSFDLPFDTPKAYAAPNEKLAPPLKTSPRAKETDKIQRSIILSVVLGLLNSNRKSFSDSPALYIMQAVSNEFNNYYPDKELIWLDAMGSQAKDGGVETHKYVFAIDSVYYQVSIGTKEIVTEAEELKNDYVNGQQRLGFLNTLDIKPSIIPLDHLLAEGRAKQPNITTAGLPIEDVEVYLSERGGVERILPSDLTEHTGKQGTLIGIKIENRIVWRLILGLTGILSIKSLPQELLDNIGTETIVELISQSTEESPLQYLGSAPREIVLGIISTPAGERLVRLGISETGRGLDSSAGHNSLRMFSQRVAISPPQGKAYDATAPPLDKTNLSANEIEILQARVLINFPPKEQMQLVKTDDVSPSIDTLPTTPTAQPATEDDKMRAAALAESAQGKLGIIEVDDHNLILEPIALSTAELSGSTEARITVVSGSVEPKAPITQVVEPEGERGLALVSPSSIVAEMYSVTTVLPASLTLALPAETNIQVLETATSTLPSHPTISTISATGTTTEALATSGITTVNTPTFAAPTITTTTPTLIEPESRTTPLPLPTQPYVAVVSSEAIQAEGASVTPLDVKAQTATLVTPEPTLGLTTSTSSPAVTTLSRLVGGPRVISEPASAQSLTFPPDFSETITTSATTTEFVAASGTAAQSYAVPESRLSETGITLLGHPKITVQSEGIVTVAMESSAVVIRGISSKPHRNYLAGEQGQSWVGLAIVLAVFAALFMVVGPANLVNPIKDLAGKATVFATLATAAIFSLWQVWIGLYISVLVIYRVFYLAYLWFHNNILPVSPFYSYKGKASPTRLDHGIPPFIMPSRIDLVIGVILLVILGGWMGISLNLSNFNWAWDSLSSILSYSATMDAGSLKMAGLGGDSIVLNLFSAVVLLIFGTGRFNFKSIKEKLFHAWRTLYTSTSKLLVQARERLGKWEVSRVFIRGKGEVGTPQAAPLQTAPDLTTQPTVLPELPAEKAATALSAAVPPELPPVKELGKTMQTTVGVASTGSSQVTEEFYQGLIKESHNISSPQEQARVALWIISSSVNSGAYTDDEILTLWKQLLDILPSAKEPWVGRFYLGMTEELVRFAESGKFPMPDKTQRDVLKEMSQGLMGQLNSQPYLIRLKARLILACFCLERGQFDIAVLHYSRVIRELEGVRDRKYDLPELIIEASRTLSAIAQYAKQKKSLTPNEQLLLTKILSAQGPDELRRLAFLVLTPEQGGTVNGQNSALLAISETERVFDRKWGYKQVETLRRQVIANQKGVNSETRISLILESIFRKWAGIDLNTTVQDIVSIIDTENNPDEKDRLIRHLLQEIGRFTSEEPGVIVPPELIVKIEEVVGRNKEILHNQTEIEYGWFRFLASLKYYGKYVDVKALVNAWEDLLKKYPSSKKDKFITWLTELMRKNPQSFPQVPAQVFPKVELQDKTAEFEPLPYNKDFVTVFHIAQWILGFLAFTFLSTNFITLVALSIFVVIVIINAPINILIKKDITIKGKPVKPYTSLLSAELAGLLFVLFFLVPPLGWIFILLGSSVVLFRIFESVPRSSTYSIRPYLIGTLAYSFVIKVIPLIAASWGTSLAVLSLVFIAEILLAGAFFYIRKQLSQKPFVLERRGPLSWRFKEYKETSNFWNSFFSKETEAQISTHIDTAWMNNLAREEVNRVAIRNPRVKLSRDLYREIIKQTGSNATYLDIDILHRVALSCFERLGIPDNGGFTDAIVEEASERIRTQLKGKLPAEIEQIESQYIESVVKSILNDQKLVLISLTLYAGGLPKTNFIDYLAHNAFLTAQPYYIEPRRAVIEDKPDFNILLGALRTQIDLNTPILEQIPGLYTWLTTQAAAYNPIAKLDRDFKDTIDEFPGHRQVAANNLRTFALGQFSHSRHYAIVELVRNALHANRGLKEEEQKVYIALREYYASVIDNGEGLDLGELNDLGEALKEAGLSMNWINTDLLSFTATGGKKFLQIAENFGLGFFSSFSHLLDDGDRVVVETFTKKDKAGYRIVVERVNSGTQDTPRYEDRIAIGKIPNPGRRGTRVEIFGDIEKDSIVRLLNTKFRYHTQGEILLDDGVKTEVVNLRTVRNLMKPAKIPERGASLFYLALPQEESLPEPNQEGRILTITIDGLSILEFSLPSERGPPELLLTFPSDTEVNLAREQLAVNKEIIEYIRVLISELSNDPAKISLLSDLYPICQYLDELLAPIHREAEATLTQELIDTVSRVISTNNIITLPNTDTLSRLAVEPADLNKLSYRFIKKDKTQELFFIHPEVWKQLPEGLRKLPFEEYKSWLPMLFGGDMVVIIPAASLPENISFGDYLENKKLRMVTRFGNIIFLDAQLLAPIEAYSTEPGARLANIRQEALKKTAIKSLLQIQGASGFLLTPEKVNAINKLLQRSRNAITQILGLFKRFFIFLIISPIKALLRNIIKTKPKETSQEIKQPQESTTPIPELSPIELQDNEYTGETDFLKLMVRFHSDMREHLKVGVSELESGLNFDDPLLLLYQNISLKKEDSARKQLETAKEYFENPQQFLIALGEHGRDVRVIATVKRWFELQKGILDEAGEKLADSELETFLGYLKEFYHPLDFQIKIALLFREANNLPENSPLRALLWKQCLLLRNMQPRDPRQTLNVSAYGQNITDLLLWIREYMQNQLDAILFAQMAQNTPLNFKEYRIHIPTDGRGILFHSELTLPPDVLFNAWLIPLVSQGKEEEGYRGEKGHGVFMSFRNAGDLFIKTAIPESQGKVLYMKINFVRNPHRMKWESTSIRYAVKTEPEFTGHSIHWIPMEGTDFEREITQEDLTNALNRYTQTILWNEMQIWLKRHLFWGLLGKLSIWVAINRSQKSEVSSRVEVNLPSEQRIGERGEREVRTPIALLVGRLRNKKQIREITSASLPFKSLSEEARQQDGREFFKGLSREFWEFLWKRGFTLDLGVAFRLTADRTELARKDEPEVIAAIENSATKLSIEAILKYFITRQLSLEQFPGKDEAIINGLLGLLTQPNSENVRKVIEDAKAIAPEGVISPDTEITILSERVGFYNNPQHLAMLICALPIYEGSSLYQLMGGDTGKHMLILQIAFKTGFFETGKLLLRNRKRLASFTKEANFIETLKAFGAFLWQQKGFLSFLAIFFGVFLTEFYVLMAFHQALLPEVIQNYLIKGLGIIQIPFSKEITVYVNGTLAAFSITGIMITHLLLLHFTKRLSGLKKFNIQRMWFVAGILVLGISAAIIIYLNTNMPGYTLPWERILLDDILIKWWQETFSPWLIMIKDQIVQSVKDLVFRMLKFFEEVRVGEDNGEPDLILQRMARKNLVNIFSHLIILSLVFGIVRRIRRFLEGRFYPRETVWVEGGPDSKTAPDSYTLYARWLANVLHLLGYRKIKLGFFASRRHTNARVEEGRVGINLHPIRGWVRNFYNMLKGHLTSSSIEAIYKDSYRIAQEAVLNSRADEQGQDISQAVVEYLALNGEKIVNIEESLRVQAEQGGQIAESPSARAWLFRHLYSLTDKVEGASGIIGSLSILLRRLLSVEGIHRINPNSNRAYVRLPFLRRPDKKQWINHLASIYPYIWIDGEKRELREYIESRNLTIEELEAVAFALRKASLNRTIDSCRVSVAKPESLGEKVSNFIDLIYLFGEWVLYLFSYVINFAFSPWISRFAYYLVYHKRDLLGERFSAIFIGALAQYRALNTIPQLDNFISQLNLNETEARQLRSAFKRDRLNKSKVIHKEFYKIMDGLARQYPDKREVIIQFIKEVEGIGQIQKGIIGRLGLAFNVGTKGVIARLLDLPQSIISGLIELIWRRGRLFLFGAIGVAVTGAIAIGSPVIVLGAKIILAAIIFRLAILLMVEPILLWRKKNIQNKGAVFVQKLLISGLPLLILAILPYLVATGQPVLEYGRAFLLPELFFIQAIPVFGPFIDYALRSVIIDFAGVAMLSTFIMIFISNLFSFAGLNRRKILSQQLGNFINYRMLGPSEIKAAISHINYDILAGVNLKTVPNRIIGLKEAIQSAGFTFNEEERAHLDFRLNQALENYLGLPVSDIDPLALYLKAMKDYKPREITIRIRQHIYILLKAIDATFGSWSFIWATVKSTFALWFAGLSLRLGFGLFPWAIDRGIERAMLEEKGEFQGVSFFEKLSAVINYPGDLPAKITSLIDQTLGLNLSSALFQLMGGEGNPQEIISEITQRKILEDIPLWQIPQYGNMYSALMRYAEMKENGTAPPLEDYLEEEGIWFSRANLEAALENILGLNAEEENPYSGKPGSGRLLYEDKVRAAHLLAEINEDKVISVNSTDLTIAAIPNSPGYSVVNAKTKWTVDAEWAFVNSTGHEPLLVNLNDPVQAQVFIHPDDEFLYYLISHQVPITFSSSINMFDFSIRALRYLAGYEMTRRYLYEARKEEAPVVFYLFDNFTSAGADAWSGADAIRFNADSIGAMAHEQGHLGDGRDGDVRGEIYMTDEQGRLVDIMDVRVFNWVLGKEESLRDIMERWANGYGDFSNYLRNPPEEGMGKAGEIDFREIAAEVKGKSEFYANLHALLTFPDDVVDRLSDPTEPAGEFLAKAAAYFRQQDHGLIIQADGRFFGLQYSPEIAEIFPDEEIGKHYVLANLITEYASAGNEQRLASSVSTYLTGLTRTELIDEISRETHLSQTDVALLVAQYIAMLAPDGFSDIVITDESLEIIKDRARTLATIGREEFSKGDVVDLPLLFWDIALHDKTASPTKSNTEGIFEDTRQVFALTEEIRLFLKEQKLPDEDYLLLINTIDRDLLLREVIDKPAILSLFPVSIRAIIADELLKNASVEELTLWISEEGNLAIVLSQIPTGVPGNEIQDWIKIEENLEQALLNLPPEKAAEALAMSVTQFSQRPFPIFPFKGLPSIIADEHASELLENIRKDKDFILDYVIIQKAIDEFRDNHNSLDGKTVPVVNLTILIGLERYADEYDLLNALMVYLNNADDAELRRWIIEEPMNLEFFNSEMQKRLQDYLFEHRNDAELMKLVAAYHEDYITKYGWQPLFYTGAYIPGTESLKDPDFLPGWLVVLEVAVEAIDMVDKGSLEQAKTEFTDEITALNLNDRYDAIEYIVNLEADAGKKLFARLDDKTILELWDLDYVAASDEQKAKLDKLHTDIQFLVEPERLLNILGINKDASQDDLTHAFRAMNLDAFGETLPDVYNYYKDIAKTYKKLAYERLYEWLEAHPSANIFEVVSLAGLSFSRISIDKPDLARTIARMIENNISSAADFLMDPKGYQENSSLILLGYIELDPQVASKVVNYLIKTGKEDDALAIIRRTMAYELTEGQLDLDAVVELEEFIRILGPLSKLRQPSRNDIPVIKEEDYQLYVEKLKEAWEWIEAQEMVTRVYENGNSLEGIDITVVDMTIVDSIGSLLPKYSQAAARLKEQYNQIVQQALNGIDDDAQIMAWFYDDDNLYNLPAFYTEQGKEVDNQAISNFIRQNEYDWQLMAAFSQGVKEGRQAFVSGGEYEQLTSIAYSHKEFLSRMMAPASTEKSLGYLEEYWRSMPENKRKEMGYILAFLDYKDHSRLTSIWSLASDEFISDIFKNSDVLRPYYERNLIIPPEELFLALGITEDNDPVKIGDAIGLLHVDIPMIPQAYNYYKQPVEAFILDVARENPDSALVILYRSKKDPYFLMQDRDLARDVFGRDFDKTADIMLNNKGYMGSFNSNLHSLFDVDKEIAQRVLTNVNQKALAYSVMADYKIQDDLEGMVFGNLSVMYNVTDTVKKREYISWLVSVLGEERVTDILTLYIYSAKQGREASDFSKMLADLKVTREKLQADALVGQKERELITRIIDSSISDSKLTSEAIDRLKVLVESDYTDTSKVVFIEYMDRLDPLGRAIVIGFSAHYDVVYFRELFAHLSDEDIARLWALGKDDKTPHLAEIRENIQYLMFEKPERLLGILGINQNTDRETLIKALRTIDTEIWQTQYVMEFRQALEQSRSAYKDPLYIQVYEWLETHPKEDGLKVVANGGLDIFRVIDERPDIAKAIINKNIPLASDILLEPDKYMPSHPSAMPANILMEYIQLEPQLALSVVNHLIKTGKEEAVETAVVTIINNSVYHGDSRFDFNLAKKLSEIIRLPQLRDLPFKQECLSEGWGLTNAYIILADIHNNGDSASGLSLSTVDVSKVRLIARNDPTFEKAAAVIESQLEEAVNRALSGNETLNDLAWFYYPENLAFLDEAFGTSPLISDKAAEFFYQNRDDPLLIAAIDEYNSRHFEGPAFSNPRIDNRPYGENSITFIELIPTKETLDNKPDFSEWDRDFWVSYLETRHFFMELWQKLKTQSPEQIKLSDFTPFDMSALSKSTFITNVNLSYSTDKAFYSMLTTASNEELLKWFEASPANIDTISLLKTKDKDLPDLNRISAAFENLLTNPAARASAQEIISKYNMIESRLFTIEQFGPEESPAIFLWGIWYAGVKGMPSTFTNEQHSAWQKAIFDMLQANPDRLEGDLPEGEWSLSSVELSRTNWSFSSYTTNLMGGIITFTNGRRFRFTYDKIYDRPIPEGPPVGQVRLYEELPSLRLKPGSSSDMLLIQATQIDQSKPFSLWQTLGAFSAETALSLLVAFIPAILRFIGIDISGGVIDIVFYGFGAGIFILWALINLIALVSGILAVITKPEVIKDAQDNYAKDENASKMFEAWKAQLKEKDFLKLDVKEVDTLSSGRFAETQGQNVSILKWLLAKSDNWLFNLLRPLLLLIVVAREEARLRGQSTFRIFATFTLFSFLKSPVALVRERVGGYLTEVSRRVSLLPKSFLIILISSSILASLPFILVSSSFIPIIFRVIIVMSSLFLVTLPIVVSNLSDRERWLSLITLISVYIFSRITANSFSLPDSLNFLDFIFFSFMAGVIVILITNLVKGILGKEPPPIGQDSGLCVTGDTLLPIIRLEVITNHKLQITNGSTSLTILSKVEGQIQKIQNPNDQNKNVELIPILEVKPGDYVLSLNEETQTIEPHRINALLDMGTKPVYRLTTASGRSIKTTANHPYLVKIKNQITKFNNEVQHLG